MPRNNILTASFLTLSAFAMLGLVAATPAQTPAQAPTAQTSAQAPSDKQQMKSGPANQSQANLLEALSLSDEQKSKVSALLADQTKQLKAVRQDTALTPEDKTARIKAVRQATQQQLRQILTAEQRQQMDELRRKARAEAQAGGATQAGAAPAGQAKP